MTVALCKTMLAKIKATRKGPEMKKHENSGSCNVHIIVFLYQRKTTESKKTFCIFAR